jgi:Flp pilus assembly protein TadD
VKVNPAYQLAQYVAGRALSETGHPERGIEYLERAVKSDPSNVEAHIALPAAYPKLRRFEDARRERRKSFELTQEAGPVAQR